MLRRRLDRAALAES